MRGDVVFRVYGVHTGRANDVYFGAFRTRAEAEAKAAALAAGTMHGASWAARYHDRGFAIREHGVEVDFEFPSRPTPRERYIARITRVTPEPGAWPTSRVEVLRRDGGDLVPVATYERNYAPLGTFEPFRRGGRDYALISRDYTTTAVLDLQTGAVIAEEVDPNGTGFCPVGFYVPDWWDVNDGSVIPGSEHWRDDYEWPTGDFGFVWGCVWGDDSSWKVQHLDLRAINDGVVRRDERFGYVPLATHGYVSPAIVFGPETPPPAAAGAPPFIHVWRDRGEMRVRFDVERTYDLAAGKVDDGDPFD